MRLPAAALQPLGSVELGYFTHPARSIQRAVFRSRAPSQSDLARDDALLDASVSSLRDLQDLRVDRTNRFRVSAIILQQLAATRSRSRRRGVTERTRD